MHTIVRTYSVKITKEKGWGRFRGPFSMKTLIPLVVLMFTILASGCETDRTRHNIQDPEPVTVPIGLMPEGIETVPEFAKTVPEFARIHAGEMVSQYFGWQRELTAKDPVLMFRGLALFEYLINALHDWNAGVPVYILLELQKSREDIRELIGLPKDISVNDAINQLYSMSKFMELAGTHEKIEESAEVSARRDVIGKYKARVTLLLKKLKSKQDLKNK